MYLTAQRLRTLDGNIGINVLLCQHGSMNIPGMSWDEPSVELVAERFPGTVVAQRLDVPPRGNHVLSYLDIVARDSVPVESILRALGSAERDLAGKCPPFLYRLEGVGIRFALEPGMEGVESEEFNALRERCADMLESPRPTAKDHPEPLTINVTFDADAVRYALDAASIARVLRRGPASRPPRGVIVDDQTRDDFERVHGDVIPHIILALTSLKLEDVLELGGVRLRDASAGVTLREWPRRP